MNLKLDGKTVFLLILLLSIGVSVPALHLMQVTETVWAESGYWQDIQNAVDEASTIGIGIVNVRIPEGTWDFINVGENWAPYPSAKVTIPAGINIFGEPTSRDADGQVIEWKTIIRIPGEFAPNRPSYVLMFQFEGNGDQNKPSRFSDIKIVGYRDIDHTSEGWYSTIRIYRVIDFRVDHCFFKNMAGMCVDVRAPANGECCGVIDHCKLINEYGYVEWDYALCTVHYAICVRFAGTTFWEDDITKVIGHYNPYTVFVEDCYFSRWRHCVSSNDGTHYVFRHNIIEKDSIVGSLDGHGTYVNVGTRAMEIHDNLIIDPVLNKHPENWDSMTPSNPTNGLQGYCVNWRGGGGVVFNNVMRNYEVGIYMVDEGTIEKCWPHDVYLWNNTFTNFRYNTLTYSDHRTIQEGVDYFLHEPQTFTYVPYPYPHPLVSGEIYIPPDSGEEEPPIENATASNDSITPSTELPSIPIEDIKEASTIFIIEIGLTVLAIVVFIKGRKKHA